MDAFDYFRDRRATNSLSDKAEEAKEASLHLQIARRPLANAWYVSQRRKKFGKNSDPQSPRAYPVLLFLGTRGVTEEAEGNAD
jgi:hypothetical protein